MNIHGSKKQKGQAQKPQIAPDDLVSTSYAKILYGLAEGEIFGLADGGKSIKLDGTPLINDNGQVNFTGVNWGFRTGTLDQPHISGFSAVENETNVGVELRSDRAWVKQITNRELSAVRVRLNFNALREQKDNGDIVGLSIEYAIDVQTDGGSYQEVLRQTVRGKASQGYKKSHRIDLPNAGTAKRWTIRVRRITPNRSSDLVSDTVYIDALTEIIDAKLAYPCTALLGLSYDAKTFANIAKVAIRLKGKIIQVPSNYNADTRQYNGLWDGTFKPAYSNNPAWVYYDLCTHRRYGLGERLGGLVDKWRLYQIAQYCDELVDNGKGGQEPRFTINVYIQKADDAYRVLQNLASVFRGLSFWDGQNIVVDADTPKEPIYTFSPANIVGGEFTYTGTRARDRHTLTKVAWDNPDNGFSTEYELIPDEQAIAKYGVRTLDISAFGCTSQGQAQRAGLWALKSEQLETQTVSFRTGLQGFIPQVGRIINVADNVFAGRAVSGKIKAVSTNKRQITLDRVAGKVGDTLTVNGTTGVESAKVTAVHGNVLTLNKAINAEPEHIWAVIADDLKLKQFRILTIIQNDDATFDITALEYNAQKYAVVDSGAVVTPQPYTALKATPINAPNSVTLTASTRAHQGQAVTTLSINWEQVTGAVAYIVEWRKDDGNWQTLPKVSGQSVDIDGVYSGGYTARVRAMDSFDNESLATSSQLTQIAGKTGRPPKIARLNVQGKLFGMDLAWTFNKGSDDTNFTEIQVSPDGRSNITILGTFAYPTDNHTINGLQGNLTQFYRGRIVDKLGNTSDWTVWVSGTTSAQADKVLNLISGKISQSHLDQSLRTPIAKIGGIESGLNGIKGQIPSLQSAISAINGQLPTLNTKIATTERHLQTAQSTLQTAVANITTERNRITSAIRDITALQNANNAKTQEIANLVQTMGNHTSSIRELGVTTGELAQKYSQLKTVADKATSDITAIRQTQAGQATTIERMNSKFGWQTLTTATDLNTLTAQGRYFIKAGNNPNAPATNWLFVDVETSNDQWIIMQTVRQDNNAKNQWVRQRHNGNWSAWEKMATGAELSTKASSADMQTLRQTVADSDSALSRRIDSIDAAYKQADTQANAKIESEITARTSADSALSIRIDNLQSEFNGNKASIASQLKTLSDKDKATATRINQIAANVTTAQQTANTAKADIITEQQTRADGDSSLAHQMSALDSKFTNANNQIKASVAQAQQTATNAQQAVATAQDQLNARFDGLSVGGRNLLRHTQHLNQHWRFASGEKGNNMSIADGAARLTGVGTTWRHLGYDINKATADAWLKDGTAFTLSVHAKKISGNPRLSVALRKGVTGGFKDDLVGRSFDLTNDWQKLVVSGTITPDDLKYLFVRFEFWGDGVIEIKKPKLEYGNISTDWSPAPEDLQVDIDSKATTASLNEFKQAQATKDTATTQKLSQLESGMGTKANATALNNYYTKAQTDQAIGGRVERFEASLKRQEINAVTDLNTLTAQGRYFIKAGNNPNAPATNWLFVDVETSNDQWIIMQTVRQDNNAKNQWVRQRHNGNWSAWEKVATGSELNDKASASALNELNTRVTQVDGKITAEANKVSQLQTTLNGQTTSIRNVEQSVNGVRAIKAVTVDNNGVISGYGLISELQNGRITSRFGINADQFYIGNPNNNKKLFNVYTSPQIVNGVTVPAGTYLDSAFIAKGSINMLHISDSIQSDNYVVNKSGWKLHKNGNFEINSSFGDGTRLQITSKGLVGWYDNHKKAFELGIFT